MHGEVEREQRRASRVRSLRRRAHAYRDRYGDLQVLAPLDRLDHAIATRLARVEHLQRIADEVLSDIKGLELEIRGIELSVEAFLGEVLPDIARRFNEGWSPTPVLGFRLWAAGESGIRGVREHWNEPKLSAACTESSDTSEIPHTDGRCGRLGCGVYAAKDAARLLSEFSPALRSSFVVGMVGLAGKVVEHEHGYRGAEAHVIAAAAVANMSAALISDPADISNLFATGRSTQLPLEFQDRAALFSAIVDFLAEQEKAQNPWT